VFKTYPLCKDYVDCVSHLPDYTIFTAGTDNLTAAGNSTGETTSEAATKPNTALFTMSITLFTFTLAYLLKGLRNKKVLGRTVSLAILLIIYHII